MEDKDCKLHNKHSDYYCFNDNNFFCRDCIEVNHKDHIYVLATLMNDIKSYVDQLRDNKVEESIALETKGIKKASETLRVLKNTINKAIRNIQEKTNHIYSENLVKLRGIENEIERYSCMKSSAFLYFLETIRQNEKIMDLIKNVNDNKDNDDIKELNEILKEMLSKESRKLDTLNEMHNGIESIIQNAKKFNEFYEKLDNYLPTKMNIEELKGSIEERAAYIKILNAKLSTMTSYKIGLDELNKESMKDLMSKIGEFAKMESRARRKGEGLGEETKNEIYNRIANISESVKKIGPTIRSYGKRFDTWKGFRESTKEDESKEIEVLRPKNCYQANSSDSIKVTPSSICVQENITYDKYRLEDKDLCWSPLLSRQDQNQYIEFTHKNKGVYWLGIEMKGMGIYWVTRFKVLYLYGDKYVTLDDIIEEQIYNNEMKEEDCIKVVCDDEYDGNVDGCNTVTRYLRIPIKSKSIRIYPTAWEYQIAMKIDALYCEKL